MDVTPRGVYDDPCRCKSRAAMDLGVEDRGYFARSESRPDNTQSKVNVTYFLWASLNATL